MAAGTVCIPVILRNNLEVRLCRWPLTPRSKPAQAGNHSMTESSNAMVLVPVTILSSVIHILGLNPGTGDGTVPWATWLGRTTRPVSGS